MIEITSLNFIKFQNLDIAAFSFAKIGAQGEGGGIKIVDTKGALYHTNFTKIINLEELFTVCPILKGCDFKLFNATVPKGWTSFYMGGGNFLVVKIQYEEIILNTLPKGLYNHWISSLVKTIHKKLYYIWSLIICFILFILIIIALLLF